MVKKANTEQKQNQPQMSREKALSILLRPVITEKATRCSEFNQVCFYVPLSAGKPEIKAAVETAFKVKVVGINTVRIKGKTKMFRGRPGSRSDRKKAIVRLSEGQSIDLASGI